MKKKLFGIMLAFAVILFAGYTAYNSHRDINWSDVTLANLETLADENDNIDGGEASGAPWTGYVNNPQPCSIKETYECKIGFTIPNWIPYIGGMSCQFNYIDEVDIPGTRNDCIYTGNPKQTCDYYRCTKNK